MPNAECHMKLKINRLSSAFTLIELLIVLAIISVVVALGIPLFGVLTGARSVEAGRNVVAAAIGQARTVAVNEGKYAGVLFYVDPATERTAMSIVIVTDPASSQEDPDPYDKYKSYVDGEIAGQLRGTGPAAEQPYYSSQNALVGGLRVRGDRVIGVTYDADNAFRSPLYANSNPLVSEYLRLFGNYRPTVRAFECRRNYTTTGAVNEQPPQNGPYGAWAGSPQTPANYFFTQFEPTPAPANPTGNTIGAGQRRSTLGPFVNANWGSPREQPTVRSYASSEQVLLPRGVGVQIMTQPLVRSGSTFSERYLRTAVIMFDSQGRLTLQREFSIQTADPENPLGDYLGLTTAALNIPPGVGLAVYDTQAFANATLATAGLKTSQADWLYLPAANNKYVLNSTFANIFGDYPTTVFNDEEEEEKWLDTNATPLVINRFTGSLSDAE